MKNKKYTFMVSILSLFGALTLILSFFLIFNFYTRGLNNAYEILNEKNTEVTNNISNTIVSSLKSVETQLNILSKITTDNNIIEDFENITKISWEQLKSDTNIASIFLADESGSFIQARRIPEFAIRYIDRTTTQQLDVWDYKNQSFGSKSIHLKKVDYDPRTRVWYKEISTKQKVYWSDPYLFASTGTPGITIAVGDFNQFNKKVKVAAADFTLDALSGILQEKGRLLNGEIVMFSATQEIIASSLMDNKQHNPEKKILTLKDLPSLKYQQIFNELMNGKQTGEINDNGKEYIYFLTKLPQLTGKDWYIASVIEKELIVADIKITMLKTVLIGLLIMIVTYFPIQYLLKKYVIEPIHRLEYMTNEIAHNRFENIKDIKTVIYEFYELSNSIMSMSQSIQKYELDQKNLIDSFIKILAESIDAKSPYTGGHCERVPEIAKMLVKEASDCKEGIFKDFNLTTEDEIREFEIAAWLHDCGKVVTPEYVVDKATKLETIYNRIHEIRTRFEVLHRDATIEYNVQLIKDVSKKEELQKQLEAQHKKLQEDFEFLAECNIGGEFMDDTKIERIKEIANLTWVRNFNDRIGLSQAELLRVGNTPTTTPQIEKLLSDKPEHVINREKDIDEADYKQYKFKVDIPNYAYNMGELYNMCIKRGTLTEEERFKINEHIIMTIKMLEQLPFTSNLQKVPEYAGSHHETMIGSGYPRKLSKEEISIPARIMAIADIFEALTASDRPYKKAKTLSESIKIMSFMAKDGHIDSDLFKLFLTSGNYLTYANTYLKPEQIDEVDITQYI